MIGMRNFIKGNWNLIKEFYNEIKENENFNPKGKFFEKKILKIEEIFLLHVEDKENNKENYLINFRNYDRDFEILYGIKGCFNFGEKIKINFEGNLIERKFCKENQSEIFKINIKFLNKEDFFIQLNLLKEKEDDNSYKNNQDKIDNNILYDLNSNYLNLIFSDLYIKGIWNVDSNEILFNYCIDNKEIDIEKFLTDLNFGFKAIEKYEKDEIDY
jgi:hypothetical protein